MRRRRGSCATDLARAPILAAFLLIAPGLTAGPAAAAEVYNFTGLPAYPNLATARMDEATRVDRLGRQCARFAGSTFDTLGAVEAWYRKALPGASETDLRNDENYTAAAALSGIKLAVGVDYVAIYRLSNQSSTAIELFRCSPRP